MTDKQLRRMYLAVKAVLLAVALALLLGGVQCAETGCTAGAVVWCWLSGVLMTALATLEER